MVVTGKIRKFSVKKLAQSNEFKVLLQGAT